MRFKIDENLHEDLAVLLADRGHNVETVYSEGMQGCDDAALAAHCRREGRAIVTLDLDFADIRSFPPAASPGIIVLRVHDQSRRHVEAVLASTLDLLDREPLAGRLWVVSESGVRIRGG